MALIGERIPWSVWPELIAQQGERRFVAYGTLINRYSIGETLQRANIHGPVITSGVRRVFNFVLEDGNYRDGGGRYERSSHPDRRATLNVQHTGIHADTVNGILFSVAADEMQHLAQREYGYDVVAVECTGSDEAEWAYIFSASQQSPQIGHRVADHVLPNESAVITCLEGAATYGEQFLAQWIESCFLADGTPLKDDPYYRDVLRDTRIKPGEEHGR